MVIPASGFVTFHTICGKKGLDGFAGSLDAGLKEFFGFRSA